MFFYSLTIQSADIMSHPSTAISSTAIVPTQDNSCIDDSHLTLRVIFGIIAFLSLLGNSFVCTIILKSSNNLRNSYNLMIFALAIVDTFTGMLIYFVNIIIGSQWQQVVSINVGKQKEVTAPVYSLKESTLFVVDRTFSLILRMHYIVY